MIKLEDGLLPTWLWFNINGQHPVFEKFWWHGFTLDEEGKKMSKSLGNICRTRRGYRELRSWYTPILPTLGQQKPWKTWNSTGKKLKMLSKMFNILWNVYIFTTTYMAIDNFNPTLYQTDDLKTTRWRLLDKCPVPKVWQKIVTESLDSHLSA